MQTLIALEGILLRAIPTFVLVWLLYFFITQWFYKPLQAVLKKREDSTEGLRKSAEGRIALAEQKAAEYEAALQASRADLYRQLEVERKKVMEHRSEVLRQARERAGQKVAEARQQIKNDVEESRHALARESEQMAAWVTRAILEGGRKSAVAKAAVNPEVVS